MLKKNPFLKSKSLNFIHLILFIEVFIMVLFINEYYREIKFIYTLFNKIMSLNLF